MLNQVVYVGQFKYASWNSWMKLPTIVVECVGYEKDEKGDYKSDDLIGVLGWDNDRTAELIAKLRAGQTLGIKGRLQSVHHDDQPTQMVVMIEKVTLLTAND